MITSWCIYRQYFLFFLEISAENNDERNTNRSECINLAATEQDPAVIDTSDESTIASSHSQLIRPSPSCETYVFLLDTYITFLSHCFTITFKFSLQISAENNEEQNTHRSECINLAVTEQDPPASDKRPSSDSQSVLTTPSASYNKYVFVIDN